MKASHHFNHEVQTMKYCMKCMARFADDITACPECGYKSGSSSETPLTGNVLAERYIVGLPTRESDFFTTYIGYDAVNDRRVKIWEFSPERYALREENGSFTPVKPIQFEKYMERFRKKAELLTALHLPDNICDVYEHFSVNETEYAVAEYRPAMLVGEHIRKTATFTFAEAEKLMLPLMSSVDKLNDDGCIFGGISADNVMITEKGTLFLDNYFDSFFFNVYQMSPVDRDFYPYERLRQNDSSDITAAGDVYSLAMILCFICGVKIPDSRKRIAEYIKKDNDILSPVDLLPDKPVRYKYLAVKNAIALEKENRTPDIETFIKELTNEIEADDLSIEKRRYPTWLKAAVPCAVLLLILGAVLAVRNGKVNASKTSDDESYSSSRELTNNSDTSVSDLIEYSSHTDDISLESTKSNDTSESMPRQDTAESIPQQDESSGSGNVTNPESTYAGTYDSYIGQPYENLIEQATEDGTAVTFVPEKADDGESNGDIKRTEKAKEGSSGIVVYVAYDCSIIQNGGYCMPRLVGLTLGDAKKVCDLYKLSYTVNSWGDESTNDSETADSNDESTEENNFSDDMIVEEQSPDEGSIIYSDQKATLKVGAAKPTQDRPVTFAVSKNCIEVGDTFILRLYVLNDTPENQLEPSYTLVELLTDEDANDTSYTFKASGTGNEVFSYIYNGEPKTCKVYIYPKTKYR